MIPLLVVSPHLDDAVLSAGQFIGSYPGAHVLTLFAGLPADPGLLTEFDRNSGFPDAEVAIEARRNEDRTALHVLGARPHYAPFTDGQYPDTPDRTRLNVATYIVSVAQSIEARRLVGPLGLMHPDHKLAADAFTTAIDQLQRLDALDQAHVYEDLPARVMDPEEAVDVRRERWPDAELEFVGTSPAAQKAHAVELYASQMWALRDLPWAAPERFWRVA